MMDNYLTPTEWMLSIPRLSTAVNQRECSGDILLEIVGICSRHFAYDRLRANTVVRIVESVRSRHVLSEYAGTVLCLCSGEVFGRREERSLVKGRVSFLGTKYLTIQNTQSSFVHVEGMPGLPLPYSSIDEEENTNIYSLNDIMFNFTEPQACRIAKNRLITFNLLQLADRLLLVFDASSNISIMNETAWNETVPTTAADEHPIETINTLEPFPDSITAIAPNKPTYINMRYVYELNIGALVMRHFGLTFVASNKNGKRFELDRSVKEYFHSHNSDFLMETALEELKIPESGL